MPVELYADTAAALRDQEARLLGDDQLRAFEAGERTAREDTSARLSAFVDAINTIREECQVSPELAVKAAISVLPFLLDNGCTGSCEDRGGNE